MKLVVLSDTHLAPRGSRRLPDAVYSELESADAILHAGDVVTAHLIHELSGFAPVYGVLGNNDDGELAAMLPVVREDEIAGVRIGMIHDSGSRDGRAHRMRRRFPTCRVVVYGHSHIPLCGEGDDGQLLFNPGSPTDKRRQPVATYGVLEVAAGEVERADIIPLGG